MITAVRRFIRELKWHKNEYVLFIVSLVIPAIICLFALDAFLEITSRIEADQLVMFDEAVTDFVYAFRSDTTTRFVTFITDVGDVQAYAIIIPLVAVLLYYRGHHRWRLSLQATIVLISASAINVGIKELISRPRPLEDMRLVMASSWSFPSGHSMSAVAFYGFLIYLTYKYVPNMLLKIALIILQVLLILSIGLSRVYLGVHYPTDVAAGFIAGLFWLIICIIVFKFINFYRDRRARQQGLNPDTDQ